MATAGTVVTSVTDDADSSTVTLSQTTPGSVVEGSIGHLQGQCEQRGERVGPGGDLEQWPDDHDPGGQSTGTVDYTVRADDAYVQGDDSLSVNISGHGGGNFENVATAGTVVTTVTDDADEPR